MVHGPVGFPLFRWPSSRDFAAFRARAKDTGSGYQTAINQALREHLASMNKHEVCGVADLVSNTIQTTSRRAAHEENRNAD